MTDHSTHPGHIASDCPLRIKVNPQPTSDHMKGYACAGTGGHCLPSVTCTILHDDGTEEDDYPDIGEEGQILFRMWRLSGGTWTTGYPWDDLEVLDRNGGSAYCLEEGEGLDYFLHSIGWTGHGWYVMHGLKGAYHKDYYGEVDVEWEDTTFRRATLPEILCGYVDAKWSDVTMRSVFSFLYEEAHLLLTGVLPR